MLLKLVPYQLTDKCLISKLYIDDKLECHILEDVPRAVKIHGKTCIPAGTYKIIITKSPRFGVMMPLLLNVPGFSGVRIHPGNVAEDTEGCLLPGIAGVNKVTDSRAAYRLLYDKIETALGCNEQVFIEINRPPADKVLA